MRVELDSEVAVGTRSTKVCIERPLLGFLEAVVRHGAGNVSIGV